MAECGCCAPTSTACCSQCCDTVAFYGKKRDLVNVYWEEEMRYGCYYGILRTMPPIPHRKRESVPLPVPVKHRQPSKRKKTPPYTYLWAGETAPSTMVLRCCDPEFLEKKRVKKPEPKQDIFCVRYRDK